MPDDPKLALQAIRDALQRPTAPLTVIEEHQPRSADETLTWARRRALWDDYHGQFSDQVIAIATVLSRRAMRQLGLWFAEDGRLREARPEPLGQRPHEPADSFTLTVQNVPVRIEYSTDYFPLAGLDHFTYRSLDDPPKPHPLSETGYRSQFVPAEIVAACGGPRAYAAQYADAKARGQEADFLSAFEGTKPANKQGRRARNSGRNAEAATPPPVVGEHTAKVVSADTPGSRCKPPSQGHLF